MAIIHLQRKEIESTKKLWAHLQHSFFQLAAAGAPCVKAAAFNYCAYLRSTTKACSCLSLLNGGMVIYSLYVLIPPLASTPPALLWLHTSHIIVAPLASNPSHCKISQYIYMCLRTIQQQYMINNSSWVVRSNQRLIS